MTPEQEVIIRLACLLQDMRNLPEPIYPHRRESDKQPKKEG